MPSQVAWLVFANAARTQVSCKLTQLAISQRTACMQHATCKVVIAVKCKMFMLSDKRQT